MKPFLKSVWIVAPASGARVPFLIVQALVSFGPEVKKVMRSNNAYPSLIKIDKELSLRPIDSKNSFFSFLFSIIAISDSILAEIFKFFVFFFSA